MNKRLTRFEMLITLGFLFMLICAVGAFFFGVQVGKDRTTANYEAEKLMTDKAKPTGKLQQQDLVSFYHTSFMPYREFQAEWISVIELANTKQSTDLPTDLKRLSSMSKQKFNELTSIAMPSGSLLEQSQQHLLKSLASFESVAKKLAASVNGQSVAQILNKLHNDPTYKEAVKLSLQGQQSYYDAMLKWAASIHSDLPDAIEMPKDMNATEWNKLPLIIKNKLSADLIVANGTIVGYYPQDLTSRIDEFIVSGQSAKLKIALIRPISELLSDTKAIRSGDFKSSMSRLYTNQLLPHLPFFLPDEG